MTNVHHLHTGGAIRERGQSVYMPPDVEPIEPEPDLDAGALTGALVAAAIFVSFCAGLVVGGLFQAAARAWAG